MITCTCSLTRQHKPKGNNMGAHLNTTENLFILRRGQQIAPSVPDTSPTRELKTKEAVLPSEWRWQVGAYWARMWGQASSASIPHVQLDLHPEEGLEVLVGHVLLQGSQSLLPAILVVVQQRICVLHPHAAGAAAHAAVCGRLELRWQVV